MRLVKVAAFVSNGGKRLVVFGDQFQAVLETEYLIERRWRQARILVDQLMQVTRRNAMRGGNTVEAGFAGVLF